MNRILSLRELALSLAGICAVPSLSHAQGETTDTLLVLLELVECDYTRAKAQNNQLVTAANRELRFFGCSNKVTYVVEY